jgi:hypothetical protein
MNLEQEYNQEKKKLRSDQIMAECLALVKRIDKKNFTEKSKNAIKE